MSIRGTCRIRPGITLAIAGVVLWPASAGAQAWDLPASLARTAIGPAAARAGTPQGRDRERPERVDRTSRTFGLGPTGSLELSNVAGNITITGGSGRDVTMEIVRRSRARNDTDAALGLQQVQVAVDQRGERASVEVVYPRERTPYQVAVDFTVTVPAGTRVTARSVSGNVSVKSVAGDVAIETVSGNVEIAAGKQVSKARSVSGNVVLSNIESTRPLTAGSMSGTLQLTHVAASRISAEVMSGDIRTDDVVCDSAQLKSLSGSVDYVGRLSAGGRYEFTSHSGSVRVTATGPVGFELQATTFSGRIRPEGLSLQAMTMNRGSLRATVGDGSAVVVAQTFSGDVVVTKR